MGKTASKPDARPTPRPANDNLPANVVRLITRPYTYVRPLPAKTSQLALLTGMFATMPLKKLGKVVRALAKRSMADQGDEVLEAASNYAGDIYFGRRWEARAKRRRKGKR